MREFFLGSAAEQGRGRGGDLKCSREGGPAPRGELALATPARIFPRPAGTTARPVFSLWARLSVTGALGEGVKGAKCAVCCCASRWDQLLDRFVGPGCQWRMVFGPFVLRTARGFPLAVEFGFALWSLDPGPLGFHPLDGGFGLSALQFSISLWSSASRRRHRLILLIIHRKKKYRHGSDELLACCLLKNSNKKKRKQR